MASYKITYRPFGSVNDLSPDYVVIHTSDTLNSGRRVNDLSGVLLYFVELSAKWGTYETEHSIISIKKIVE